MTIAERNRLNARKWREKNKEKFSKYLKEYREKNKEKLNKYSNEWYHKNKHKKLSTVVI